MILYLQVQVQGKLVNHCMAEHITAGIWISEYKLKLIWSLVEQSEAE